MINVIIARGKVAGIVMQYKVKVDVKNCNTEKDYMDKFDALQKAIEEGYVMKRTSSAHGEVKEIDGMLRYVKVLNKCKDCPYNTNQGSIPECNAEECPC